MRRRRDGPSHRSATGSWRRQAAAGCRGWRMQPYRLTEGALMRRRSDVRLSLSLTGQPPDVGDVKMLEGNEVGECSRIV